MRWQCLSKAGAKHSCNEDAALIEQRVFQGIHVREDGEARSSVALFVSDGLGAHSHGEIASNQLLHAVAEELRLPFDIGHLAQTVRLVGEKFNGERTRYAPGATLAGIIIETESAYICWAGDTKIFEVTGSALTQLSIDDIVTISGRRLLTNSVGGGAENGGTLHFLRRKFSLPAIICSDGAEGFLQANFQNVQRFDYFAEAFFRANFADDATIVTIA